MATVMTLQGAIETMLAVARRDGVADSANRPFYLQAEQESERAVLLVHGFTASPWEMRPLADDLGAAGFASLAVRLSGHGTSPEDLATRRWEEWHDDVIAGYRALAKDYRHVYAVGVSTGALLLLNASRHEHFSGLALLSPYLRLQHRLAPWAGVLRWVVSHHKSEHHSAVSPYYYDRRPLAGVHQLNRLVATIEPELAEIKTPALILGGKGDQTIDIDSTWDLFMQLGAEVKDYHQFGPEAPHVLCGAESPVQGETLQRVRDFFLHIEKSRV